MNLIGFIAYPVFETHYSLVESEKVGIGMSNSWDPVVGTTAYQQNLDRLNNVAKSKRYYLNPDEERVKKVVGLMTMNFSQTNQYFWPCKQSHPLDVKQDTACPYPEMDQEVAQKGNCFCRLFYK